MQSSAAESKPGIPEIALKQSAEDQYGGAREHIHGIKARETRQARVVNVMFPFAHEWGHATKSLGLSKTTGSRWPQN